MLGRIPYVVPRAAYSAAKHYLNALTANFRIEVQQSASRHPDFARLAGRGRHRLREERAPRRARTRARCLTRRRAEEVAAVIVDVIESRRPDVYTRPGSRQRVADYYAAVGEDA